MINTIQFARESKIPYLRHLPRHAMRHDRIRPRRRRTKTSRQHRNSIRRRPTASSINLRELLGVDEMGGTMRLGAWPCKLEPGSFAAKAYGKTEISERHRHRYEFNRDYEKTLTNAGLRITGRTPDENYVEIIEAPEHPWFLGCQFHPEFKSKPLEPHPLFAAFIGAALEHKKILSRQATEAPRVQAVAIAPRANA